jgi:signal transduction histidine kinase
MLSPNKNLIPRRPSSLGRQVSRVQRRRVARRQKLSVPIREISFDDFRTEQLAGAALPSLQSISPSHGNPGGPTEQQANRREAFLKTIVEACAANVAVLDEQGEILYVSKSWRLSTEKHCLPTGRQPLDPNYLERWNSANLAPSDSASALAHDIQDIIDGKVKEFHNEYWRPGLTGSRWFVVHATRLQLPGSDGAFRVLVNSEDTTRTRQAEEALRALGGRLITAQEEERSRVARELHDDLNQRMALLSIELEQLSQRVPAAQDDFRESIQNVWARAQEISAEIHRVSYQLHPSKLDHLGLVAATRSLCNELAKHHEIEIAFREKGCDGPLPKEITLCLFRIVQEALRNVIKHSGARKATVILAGSADVIRLSISDTGRGFDSGALEAKSGLGLISMRERLRSVGGVISIHSTDRGTKIEVAVPVAAGKIRREESQFVGLISQISTQLQ